MLKISIAKSIKSVLLSEKVKRAKKLAKKFNYRFPKGIRNSKELLKAMRDIDI